MILYSCIKKCNDQQYKPKMQLFLPNLGPFSPLKLVKLHFLNRTNIEYFHLNIFVILWVYLIKKIWVWYPGSFSLFQSFSGHRVRGPTERSGFLKIGRLKGGLKCSVISKWFYIVKWNDFWACCVQTFISQDFHHVKFSGLLWWEFGMTCHLKRKKKTY